MNIKQLIQLKRYPGMAKNYSLIVLNYEVLRVSNLKPIELIHPAIKGNHNITRCPGERRLLIGWLLVSLFIPPIYRAYMNITGTGRQTEGGWG